MRDVPWSGWQRQNGHGRIKLRDLHSPEVQKQTDAELTQIITKGKGKMAPFESKLSKEQIEQVVGYIRDLGKKQ